jgi:hypothetical protein
VAKIDGCMSECSGMSRGGAGGRKARHVRSTCWRLRERRGTLEECTGPKGTCLSPNRLRRLGQAGLSGDATAYEAMRAGAGELGRLPREDSNKN